MQVEYESVMYGRGLTTQDNPAGFADPSHYDVTPSPLSIEGGGSTNLFGDGGILSGITSVFKDIENGNSNIGTVLTGINTIRNINNLSNADLNAEKDSILNGALAIFATSAINGLNNAVFPSGNTAAQTQSLQLADNNNSIFSLPRNDALNVLNNNQQAKDDFAFRNLYFNSQQSGNLNDRKESWNSLSRSQKDAFGQVAIDNFDNIRNAQ
jgi:hypothetical protein